MSFIGIPVIFALALSMLVVVLLVVSHILHKVNNEVIVPTTLFWQVSVRRKMRSVLTGHFKNIFTFLFLLLISLLFIMAMTRPVYDKGKEHYIFVFDLSNKMAEMDNGRTKLSNCQEAASAIIDSLQYSDDVTLVLAGENIEIVMAESNNKAMLKSKISELMTCSSTASSLIEAFSFASNIYAEEGNSSIIIYSNIVSEYLADSVNANSDFFWYRPGSGYADLKDVVDKVYIQDTVPQVVELFFKNNPGI